MNIDQGHKNPPGTHSNGSFDLYVMLGLFLATLLIIAYDLKARPALHPDLERYIHIAASIRAGEWDGAVNYHYPPLFPLLIAGAGFVAGGWEGASKMVSALSAALLVFPVYFLSLSVFGRRPAVLAAGFFSFSFIGELAVCKAEQPAMLFIYLAVLFGLKALVGRKPYMFFLTGLAFGAGFMTKPEASAYFLAYLFILVGAGIIARRVGEPAPETDAEDRARAGFQPRRPLIPALALLAGYFLVTGPYLAGYYRDTGRLSLNPKARTLFAIHNFLYLEHNLYRVQLDEQGHFTQAQRIYMEGDKKPVNFPVISKTWEDRNKFVGIYFRRLAYSAKEIIAGHYLQKIAPWVWPLLMAAGLWPSGVPKKRRLELYLHVFALVTVVTVPLFSHYFPRFYFMMVPWFMMVMGRGVSRTLEWAAGRFGSERGQKIRRCSLPAVLSLLMFVAVIEIAAARPDQGYWNAVDYRRQVAGTLKSMLDDGCRYLAEIEHPSIWSLAGIPPRRQELLPSATLEGVLLLARDRGCRYLVIHQTRFLEERYHHLVPLLDHRFSHPAFRPVLREDGPALDTYVIYEIQNVQCGAGSGR